MNILVSFGQDVYAAPANPKPLEFEPDGLVRVLHDYQMPPNYQPRFLDHGDPETFPGLNGSRVIIGDITNGWNAWGRYWLGLNRLANTGISDLDLQKGFWSLTDPARAFTNYDRYKLQDIVCGGATLRAVTGNVLHNGYMEVHCLNGTKNPPALPASLSQLDMTLHFWATNIAAETLANGKQQVIQLPDGSYRVDPFPQFPNGCLVPFVSKSDTDYIAANRLLPVSSIARPYNP